jgi:signal transduction histidine kinase
LGVLLKAARKRGAEGALVDGIAHDVSYLRATKNRVDWSVWCHILRNARSIWSQEELSGLNEAFIGSAFFSYVGVVARFLFTTRNLFDWICKRSVGAGAQLFSNVVTPSYEHVGSDSTVIRLEIGNDYEPSPEFFWMTRGAFIAMPRLVGSGSADVDMTIDGRIGVYRVRYRNKRGTLSALLRWLLWPFRARSAAKELKAAHEELQERFYELETAHEQIQRQAAALAEYQAGLERKVDERTRELREARDQLATTVDQLREAQEVRQRFFANISHEIRTPLSLILLAARDVETRTGAALDDRARGNLGSIGDAARKLVRLVDELLLLAAGQEGKLRVHREPTDLAELLRRLEIAWRPAAEAAGLELAVDLPAVLIANVDPVAIERIASNLVSNAVKYTPKPGRVDIVLAVEPSGVRLSVLDTGPGIAEELASRLFGRFERATSAERVKAGTGLGLSLVKQLVEVHGGQVQALPRAGAGCELRVVLPLAVVLHDTSTRPRDLQLDDVRAVVPTATPIAIVTPPGISAGTILVAEDDVALASQVARLLAERYTVVVAHDGARALEAARTHRPQLLITDVDMPELDGIELARRFRDVTGDHLAPIVMLSAVVDLRTRVAGLEAGAVDYISKPFDPLELSARVDAQFRMRELAMRLHRAEQLSALGILTSGLAHELRNPANGIVNAIGPLTSLLPPELTRPGTATHDLLDVMASCADQVGFLARQLLGFRDGTELEVRNASVHDLVDRAVSVANRALASVDLRLELACDGDVVCAPPLLVQVLTNLIENAAHAAGPGGWVEVRGQMEAGRLRLTIADSGPGVPEALRERVFEPFFTTKPEGSGTGLGLPLARAIIHRHHGTLEIREYLGRSVFVIELPDHSRAAATASAV